ncbi:MAG: hypothetical protein V1747_02465 [Candidatus Omnitrophota bacterium]
MNYTLLILCFLLVSLLNPAFYVYAQNKKPDNGKVIFESKCNQCHSLSRPLSEKKNLEEWTTTTLRMSEKTNSNINPEEAKDIAEYLTSILNK